MTSAVAGQDINAAGPGSFGEMNIMRMVADHKTSRQIEMVLPGGPLQEKRIGLDARAIFHSVMRAGIDLLQADAFVPEDLSHVLIDFADILDGEEPPADTGLIGHHKEQKMPVKLAQGFKDAGQEDHLVGPGKMAAVVDDGSVPIEKNRPIRLVFDFFHGRGIVQTAAGSVQPAGFRRGGFEMDKPGECGYCAKDD